MDNIPPHLREIVPDTLTVAAPDWWAKYGLVAAGYNAPPAPTVRAFAQTDPRWNTDRMGGTAQTIGGWGCAMCCACMVYSQRDPATNPQTFNAILSAHGGYNVLNGEAHLAWERLPQMTPELQWLGRKDWTRRLTTAELADVLAKIAARPLILWVDYKPQTAAMDTHFVLALAANDTGTDVRILDPIDGAEAWLLQRYAAVGHDLARAIWGYRELVTA